MNTVRRRGAGTEWGVKQDGGKMEDMKRLGGGARTGELVGTKKGARAVIPLLLLDDRKRRAWEK